MNGEPLTRVIISLARSRDKSAEMKQLRPLSATPASYWFCEFKSFRIILVASINSCKRNQAKSSQLIKVSSQMGRRIRCNTHFTVGMKTLRGGQVSNSLVCKLWRTHNFNDVESSPWNVVAEHLDLCTPTTHKQQHSLKVQVAQFNWSCLRDQLCTMHCAQPLANWKDTHICQFCHSIALHIGVILAQLLFDLLHALRNVFGLKNWKYSYAFTIPIKYFVHISIKCVVNECKIHTHHHRLQPINTLYMWNVTFPSANKICLFVLWKTSEITSLSLLFRMPRTKSVRFLSNIRSKLPLTFLRAIFHYGNLIVAQFSICIFYFLSLIWTQHIRILTICSLFHNQIYAKPLSIPETEEQLNIYDKSVTIEKILSFMFAHKRCCPQWVK